MRQESGGFGGWESRVRTRGGKTVDAELAEALSRGRQLLEQQGVFATEEGLRWAAAYGIMLSVWRNGPIEDAHASRPTSRRKALHDGTMFARNTWITRQAFDVLGSDDRFRLYNLEDLILDRNAVWPGCDGTLTDFGWGYLGEIKKHVKQRIDFFAHYEKKLTPDDFLVLAFCSQALMSHVDHYGMPKWPACVEAAVLRLRGEDEAFLAGCGDRMKSIGPAPDEVSADRIATG
nr:hypothetical protein [Streptomyces sp. SID10815]